MNKQSTQYKRLFREQLSRKFCEINNMEIRTHLNHDKRREFWRYDDSVNRLNQGHKLNAHKKVQNQLS